MDGPSGFLGSIDPGQTFDDPGSTSRGPSVTPGGSAPTPFDALDGRRLAGPQGSHPLVRLTAADLLRASTDGLEGSIELAGPVRVGEGISGTIRVRATRAIKARSAGLRLVGVRIAEETRSGKSREAEAADALDAANTALRLATGGSTGTGGTASRSAASQTISWVEVHGSVIEELTFTQPVLPVILAPGELVEAAFTIPAPRLGPASAHAGTAIVAWAVEARWDIAMGSDERVAALVPVGQHPDLLRSGAVTLPSGALFDLVDDEGARLSVDPLPPLAAGSQVTLGIAWPDAPGGRSARIELTTDVKSSVGLSVTSLSLPAEGEALAGTQVAIQLPADLPPTLATDGLTVGHRLRVIVDRPMRPDVTRERPIVVI
ncbi:MAG: hypothetical protein ABWZ82_03280 [Candidatus Limnocylindrales bacterium]